jgi:hypothetical protein
LVHAPLHAALAGCFQPLRHSPSLLEFEKILGVSADFFPDFLSDEQPSQAHKRCTIIASIIETESTSV